MSLQISALQLDEKAQWLEWEQGYRRWRNQVFVIFWITYAAFYLCRVNFFIAIPDIIREYGWSKSQMGVIGTAFFWTYAIGQFVHGQISERFSSIHYLFVTMLLSAAMNALMIPAAGYGILAMGVVWAFNGLFQAGGWPNCIKTLSQWFPPKARGKRMGIYGSCYQFGYVMSWILSGCAIANYGWRGAFLIAPIILSIIAFLPLLFGKNRPEDANLPPIEIYEQHGTFAGMSVEQMRARIRPKNEKEEHAGFAFTVKQTLGNPRVWAVAWSFFFLDIICYSFLFWAPTYLFEVQKAGIAMASCTAIALPAFGIAGSVFSGWASDRFFQGRRPPIGCIFMVILGLLVVFLYYGVPQGAWVLSFITLGLIGFCAFGTQVILIAAAPMDMGTRKAAGSVAGFIDFFGHIGAGIGGVFSGFLADKYGWPASFWFWMISAFLSSAILARLWKYKPAQDKYL